MAYLTSEIIRNLDLDLNSQTNLQYCSDHSIKQKISRAISITVITDKINVVEMATNNKICTLHPWKHCLDECAIMFSFHERHSIVYNEILIITYNNTRAINK